MPETVHLTTSLESQPRFLALLCTGLLFKLAGQQTFTVGELSEYSTEFDGLKISCLEAASGKPEDSTVTVALHRTNNKEQ